MSDDCTQGKLNAKEIEHLKECNKFLVDSVTEIKTSINSLVLLNTEMKTDFTWLKDKVEGHIKNSVEHINQIQKNKDLSEKTHTELNNNNKMTWFLFTMIVGGAIYIVRDALTKGG